MLTFEEAKKIGINACIDKIGRDFVKTYRDSGCSCYGEDDGIVYCFVGVDDRPCAVDFSGPIVLDDSDEAQFRYFAECEVRMEDGSVTITKFALPS